MGHPAKGGTLYFQSVEMALRTDGAFLSIVYQD
jgi:hypothetical protein